MYTSPFAGQGSVAWAKGDLGLVTGVAPDEHACIVDRHTSISMGPA
jgi:hypothetical protein